MYEKKKEFDEKHGFNTIKAEDIADTVWYAANVSKHVCINDIVMTCVAQANSMYLHKDA